MGNRKWSIYRNSRKEDFRNKPEIGVVNGLAVHGANIGMLMEIEATAKEDKR